MEDIQNMSEDEKERITHYQISNDELETDLVYDLEMGVFENLSKLTNIKQLFFKLTYIHYYYFYIIGFLFMCVNLLFFLVIVEELVENWLMFLVLLDILKI